MKFAEFKVLNHQQLRSFPMMFAFSNKQLEEGLTNLGVTKDQIVAIGHGGFIRKADLQAFKSMLKGHVLSLSEFLSVDEQLQDALVYELSEHEFCITHDPSDALAALGLDFDTLTSNQNRILSAAISQYRQKYL